MPALTNSPGSGRASRLESASTAERSRALASLLAARVAVFVAGLLAVGLASGCATRSELDVEIVAAARLALQAEAADFPDFELPPEDRWEIEKPPERGSIGEVILGEVIAIVPGLILPGLGHLYAGDRRTAGKLMRVGGTGIVLTGIGGALAGGGYLIQQDDDIPDGFAYSLYTTGAIVGVVGLAYYLTAYVFNVVDTPRSVRSGGRPPRRSPFVDGLDFFDS